MFLFVFILIDQTDTIYIVHTSDHTETCEQITQHFDSMEIDTNPICISYLPHNAFLLLTSPYVVHQLTPEIITTKYPFIHWIQQLSTLNKFSSPILLECHGHQLTDTIEQFKLENSNCVAQLQEKSFDMNLSVNKFILHVHLAVRPSWNKKDLANVKDSNENKT
jgi:hypothetical protein